MMGWGLGLYFKDCPFGCGMHLSIGNGKVCIRLCMFIELFFSPIWVIISCLLTIGLVDVLGHKHAIDFATAALLSMLLPHLGGHFWPDMLIGGNIFYLRKLENIIGCCCWEHKCAELQLNYILSDLASLRSFSTLVISCYNKLILLLAVKRMEAVALSFAALWPTSWPSDLCSSELGKIMGYMTHAGYGHRSSWVWVWVLNFPPMQNPHLWARVGEQMQVFFSLSIFLWCQHP